MTVFNVSKFYLELIKGKQLRPPPPQKKVSKTCTHVKKETTVAQKLNALLLGLKNIFTIRKLTKNGN
jgi:hypothetical protein